MKLLTALVLLVAGCNSHDVQDEVDARDNVFFTSYNALLKTGEVRFAPADPEQHTTVEDGIFNTISYSHESEGTRLLGMTASYDSNKVWVNTLSDDGFSRLKQYDLSSGSGATVAFGLTRGLENLAYDRVTKILYWTDPTKNVIRAIELTFRHFTEVYRSAEQSPHALTVHPVKRRLFFSVYKTDNNNSISDARLIKSDMDGGNQRTILRFPNIMRPRGITIDFSSDLLFWTDQNLLRQATIMSCDLNGGRKKQVFAKSLSSLWGIAYYKGYIYATDIVNTTGNKYGIEIRKTTGRDSYTRKLNARPRNIAIYGPDETASTNVTNECDDSKCEHICLARGNGGFVCKCSPGFILTMGYKCVSDSLTDDYIMVADYGQKRLFQLPLSKSAGSVGELVAIDQDDVTDYQTYAASTIKKTGELAWHDMSTAEIVWGKRRIYSSGVVLSVTTGCCNERVYWNSRTVIYSWDGISIFRDRLASVSYGSNSKIRQVVVDCKANRLYFILYDDSTQTSFVERGNLKAKNVEMVLSGLPISYAMTIDYESYTLHVLTASEGVVYSIPLKDLERSVPSTSPNHAGYTRTELKPHIKSDDFLFRRIAVVDGYAYITDDTNGAIMRFNLKKGASSLEHYGRNQVFNPWSIDFYSESYYAKYLRPICEPSIGNGLPTTTTPAPTTTKGSYCREYYKDQLKRFSRSTALFLFVNCLQDFSQLYVYDFFK